MNETYLSRRLARVKRSIARRLGPRVAKCLYDKSYFLQSQMAIHPKSMSHRKDFVAATGGYQIFGEQTVRTVGHLDAGDTVRRDALILLLRSVIERKVPGDFVELGVWKGQTAKLIHDYAPERVLHLFDTFEGFDAKDVEAEKAASDRDEKAGLFSDTNAPAVLAYIGGNKDNVRIYPGFFPETFPDDLNDRRFAFVHLDVDLYQPTMAGLEYLFERLSPGGIAIVHDYNAWQGVRKAVDGYFTGRAETPLPLPDASGSAVIVKI